MSDGGGFTYVALDGGGRKVRGAVTSLSDAAAYELLKSQGLSPLKLRPTRHANRDAGSGLGDQALADLAADLAALLRAGVDMRTALGVLGGKATQPTFKALARTLSAEIAGGAPLEEVFARGLPARHQFVGSLIAAGEASGDIAGSLERAAAMLEARLQTRDRLLSVLSYPVFVFISAIVGFATILLFVIPPLAPLAASGGEPSPPMKILLLASAGLRASGPALAIALALALALGLFLVVFGAWQTVVDRILFNGPTARLVRGIVFGGFAISLGGILSAGTPMGVALRLAVKTTRSPSAQRLLKPVVKAVREGQSLSSALAQVRGLPPSIARLTAIGEEASSLGPMLLRAGRLEEQAAFRKIDALGKLLGPVLIVGLGGLIGLLMTGLLSGVSSLGEAALQ